jgi:RNA polymerase sigma-70 factor, ECF subfamily
MVRRTRGGLGEALAALPERQRRALLLREWRRLSYAEIAEELGVAPTAVGPLLYRARRTLAKRL